MISRSDRSAETNMRSLVSAGSEVKSSNLACVNTFLGEFLFPVNSWREVAFSQLTFLLACLGNSLNE
jgi:hypothetical protein